MDIVLPKAAEVSVGINNFIDEIQGSGKNSHRVCRICVRVASLMIAFDACDLEHSP